MDDKEKHINEMAKHMLNNNLALFIGAGFSNIFGYPSWGKLLHDIIDEYKLNQSLKSTSLFSFVEKDEFENSEDINDTILEKLLGVDYLRLAGYIDHILDSEYGVSIYKAVADKIIKYEELRRKNKDVEYLIDFFQNRKDYLEDIITTNYDSNIEYCFDNEISVIHRNLESLNNISYKNKVFKIHGCITDINTEGSSGIIITEKDYNNFKNKNKYLFYKIYSFFTEKKIVFIGYSINDPNIRSLLNDVIEENDGKVGLQIYWVTRDKLKDLDRQYYEKHFKLKIIEQMNIIDFFKKLDFRVKKNIELKEIVNAELTEYCKVYIDNYDDESFIEDIKKSDKTQDVLQCLYNRLIEEETRKALKPYFILLSKSDKDIIRKNRLSIENIIEMQNYRIFRIIDLINSNDEVKALIESNNLLEIVLDSLIEYSRGSHPFGEYAESIKYLLIVYELYTNEIKQKIDIFIDALCSNILMSCSDNPKYIGYDWRGLGVVEENIRQLDEEDLLKLINKLSRDYIDDPRQLQLEYVIENSSLGDSNKQIMLYKNLYKKQLKSSIASIIRSIMRTKLKKEYQFERTEDDTYLKNDIEIDFEILVNENRVEYIIKDITADTTIVYIYHDLIGEGFEVSIDNIPKAFKSYHDFEKYENGLKERARRLVDKYLADNGLVGQLDDEGEI